MNRFDAERQKLEARLAQWKADIDRLEAQAREAEADMRIRYLKEVESLRAQQREMQGKLDQLREAGEKASQDMLDGAEQAWRAFGESVRTALSRFR
jgi:hypothetical protein